MKLVSRSDGPPSRPTSAVEHLRQRTLAGTEAHEDRPVLADAPVRDVPPEDLPELVLVGPRDMRGRRLWIELRGIRLAAPDGRLLRLHRQVLPGLRIVLPLLQEEDRAAFVGRPGGSERDRRGLDQRRVLGPVHEPGQVEVVVVGPADQLVHEHARLDPVFDHDIFVRDESEAIAADFIAGLSAVYADPDTADVCALFTERGWTEALAFDPRLRAAGGGAAGKDLVLRIAFEGTYDLGIDRRSSRSTSSSTSQRVPAPASPATGSTWTSCSMASAGVPTASARSPRRTSPGRFSRRRLRRVRRARASSATLAERRSTSARSAPWCDEGGLGRSISSDQLVLLTRYPCDTGTAAVLNLGRPLGTSLDPLDRWEYVRDPAGEFLAQDWLTAPYDGHATLPTDATDTGWTNGNVDLWISPSDLDHAVYLVRGDVVERWPRAARSWGVIDCN